MTASPAEAQAATESSGRANEWRTLRKLLRMGRPQLGLGLVVLFLGLASAFFEGLGLLLLIPLLELASGTAAETSNSILGPVLEAAGLSAVANPMTVASLIVSALIASILVSVANMIVSNVLAMRFAHDVRLGLFDFALLRPFAEVEALPQGKLVNSVTYVTWQVCGALFIVVGLVINFTACLIFLNFLVSISLIYTLVLCVVALMTALIVHLATQRVHSLGAAAIKVNEDFVGSTWETVSGLRTIRGFGREKLARDGFQVLSLSMWKTFFRLKVYSGLVGPISQVMTLVMVGTLFALALTTGDDINQLIAFVAIAYRMQPRVSAILGARTGLRGAAAAIDEISTMLDAVPPRPERSVGRRGHEVREGIALVGVSVRYPNASRDSLTDITCRFGVGEITALAGRSGAGKSTLAALILRFIGPDHGEITVDGVPLSKIDPVAWHRRVAFVDQSAFLFDTTVLENIGFGNADAEFEDIVAAAEAAHADEFIRNLPHGYLTRIGSSGVQLSQGQRQRVALARALVRDPHVLVLDEATNALDRTTEIALRDAIISGRSRRVTIVIAHRPETARAADVAIVLDEGRLVEAGRVDDLARDAGHFARLYGPPAAETT